MDGLGDRQAPYDRQARYDRQAPYDRQARQVWPGESPKTGINPGHTLAAIAATGALVDLFQFPLDLGKLRLDGGQLRLVSL